MLFDKNKTILATLVTTLAFASAPALADNDWDDDDDDDDRPRAAQVYKKQQQKPTVSAAKISRERAIAIAKSRYKGARITDVDLERSQGRAYYQVDLKDRRYDYEVWVDAQTGKITRAKKELDD